MTAMTMKRWETARQQMVRRWEEIVRRIDARDAGAALALANMLDEFCELAAIERQAAAGRPDDPAVPVLKFPSDAALSGRCVFCRAFVSHGGCFGPTHALNKAMIDRRWEEARRVAAEQLERVRHLSFGDPASRDTVH